MAWSGCVGSQSFEPGRLDLMKIDNMSLEGRGREKSQETSIQSEQNHCRHRGILQQEIGHGAHWREVHACSGDHPDL